MDQLVKDEWIEALRSGNWPQTTGTLAKTEDGIATGYCCLGVLSEIAYRNGVVGRTEMWQGSEDSCFAYGDQTGMLPSEVQEWAGLDSDPGFEMPAKQLLEMIPDSVSNDQMSDLHAAAEFGEYRFVKASLLNDSYKLTFNQIADLFEQYL